jgi:hypothetical protein
MVQLPADIATKPVRTVEPDKRSISEIVRSIRLISKSKRNENKPTIHRQLLVLTWLDFDNLVSIMAWHYAGVRRTNSVPTGILSDMA